METNQLPAALGGLRVLDLTGEPGQYAAKLLADLGADVLRVEPASGDPARQRPPFLHDQPGPNRSLAWLHYHTNKRGLALDFDQPADQDKLRALAQVADVVLETAPPGYWAAPGLDYQRIQAENPGLIWAAITPFGQTGPRRGWQSSELIALATGGMLTLTGEPTEPPVQLGAQQAYHLAGLHAAIAVLAALRHRDQGGSGQCVDVSLQEAVASSFTDAGATYRDLAAVEACSLFPGIPAGAHPSTGWT